MGSGPQSARPATAQDVVYSIFYVDGWKESACQEKVWRNHTKSCNVRAGTAARDALLTPISRTQTCMDLLSIQHFRDHQPHESQNFAACHAKRTVVDFLQIHQSTLLEILRKYSGNPAPATHVATGPGPCACHAKRNLRLKSAPTVLVFNALDYQIVPLPQLGANSLRLDFQRIRQN